MDGGPLYRYFGPEGPKFYDTGVTNLTGGD